MPRLTRRHPGSALDKMFDATEFHKGVEWLPARVEMRSEHHRGRSDWADFSRSPTTVTRSGRWPFGPTPPGLLALPSWPFDSSRSSRWPFSVRQVHGSCADWWGSSHWPCGAPLRRGRALPRRLLRLPPRLAHAARRPAQRRDPGVSLPAAPRGAARPVGQRDLPPGRLGRRRGGGEVLPGAAHGQRSGAADEPDLPDRRPRVGGLHRRGRRAAPVSRRHGRGRVPVPHEPPLLPVRVDGGQPGPPGGAAAARGLIPRGQVARAG